MMTAESVSASQESAIPSRKCALERICDGRTLLPPPPPPIPPPPPSPSQQQKPWECHAAPYAPASNHVGPYISGLHVRDQR